jgi:beta-phosphoglucomutase-like phosphatase (HAD superfamily)
MPQLLVRAARNTPLDLTTAVVVSDQPHFLRAAASLGCRTILVSDGARPAATSTHPFEVQDLAGAVRLLLDGRSETVNRPVAELQAIS